MKSTLLILFLLFTSVAVDGGANDDPGGMGGVFGPGVGFNVPGLGPISGIMSPTVICRVKGPCYLKRLRCPPKCFKSFNRNGNGFGYGGGGGGCTMDCVKNCTAYC